MIMYDPFKNKAFITSNCRHPIQFKRLRSKPGDDGGRRLAGAFRIVFPAPVKGPVALGHSSHFGLGMFVPEMESNPDRSGAIPKTIIDKE